MANNINVSFKGLNGENAILRLSEKGIMCSTGSACNEKKEKENRILRAIGIEKSLMNGTLRFSLGFETSKKDIDYVLKELKKIVE